MYFLHLKNVPDSADETIIRRYFKDLEIADGGVEIIGGINGDVLINFVEDSDMLKALTLGDVPIHGCRIKILLAEEADKEQIIAKALKPPRPSKRSKSSKSSSVPELSTSHAAIPETAELRDHPGAGYGAPTPYDDQTPGRREWTDDNRTPGQREWTDDNQTSGQREWSDSNQTPGQREWTDNSQTPGQREWTDNSQTPGQREWTDNSQTPGQREWTDNSQTPGQREWTDDNQTPGRREWSDQLKTKLLFSTTQRPQLASDIVKNALLKMNEGQQPAPIDKSYTPPSQVAPPPEPKRDIMAEMLKNIMRSTNIVPTPRPFDPPYNQAISTPQLSGSAGMTVPQMPPGQQWGTQVLHPHFPPPVPPPNQWPVLPNTSTPPPGLIHTPFRQQVPAPTHRPPMAYSSKVVPSPSPVAVSVPVPKTLPSSVPANSAQALGSAPKQSRWGGSAVGSTIPPPITQKVNRTMLPKTSMWQPPGTVPSGKQMIAINLKQRPSTISQKAAINPALKRERTPAQPSKTAALKTKVESIVIIDSDSDSESDVKQKKRKLGNVRGRSRSRSRGRSRSRSRSRRRSTSKGRDRSRSRRRDRSKSRGRRRSRSKSRSRSRSRSKRRRSRDRSRSKEKDRGREQRQRPRIFDQDRARKPVPVVAPPKVPRLLELPANKPISLEMFKNDPNSISVHNVAETVTLMVFRDFFYGHPIVKDGIVLTPSDDIPNCQTGYIKFIHGRDVEESKQLSFTTLDGKKLLIKSCYGAEEESPVVQTGEAVSKVGAEPEGAPPTKTVIEYRETIPKPLKVLKIPAPKDSPFGLLGVSEHITSYHIGLRGFNPGTTATEMWSWFGGSDGHVKGIIVSHRIRKDDDELAFIMYGNKALRNTFRSPKNQPQLVWHRYSEKAAIHKLISNDVCYLTETSHLGQDREVSKAEIRHLRHLRPDGPSKPPLQVQEEDVPQTESSKIGQGVPLQKTPRNSLEPWKKLSYICLHETPKGVSASKVWSWYGGEKGHSEGVILANCKSKNELKGDRFNIAFVGFRDPYVVQQEIDKRSSGQRYSSDGTFRFLARLPDSGMIFKSTTSGQDCVLSKQERLEIRGQYLTQEEIHKNTNPEDIQTLPPSWKEFELSEEFGRGLFFLQLNDPEVEDLTASKALSWYPPETFQTRGAVLQKKDGKPAFAFVAFSDNLTRNKACTDFRSNTGKAWKASWAFTVRRFTLSFAEEGQDIFISTKSGVDRPITEEEKAYCLRILHSSAAWNTNKISRAFITDPDEYAREVEKDAAIASAAAADKSDELFYLHLKRIPPKVTACEAWNWFYGSTGNSKSVVVVYGSNGIATSGYVGFEREDDRDIERPKQRFSKVSTYRSRGVRLLTLPPGCRATESTITGVDRVLNEDDFGVIRWKLRAIDGVDKRGKAAEEDGESTSSDQTRENYKERSSLPVPGRDYQIRKTFKNRAWLPGAEPPLEGQRERNTQVKSTVTPNNQSKCVQIQGKQHHSSLQEIDSFKKPSTALQGKPLETLTPTEHSIGVQRNPQPQDSSLRAKGVKTITPYAQSPWVQVQTKEQSQLQHSSSQGKDVETITPYTQAPWVQVVQVEQKPQPEPSSLEPWQRLSYLCLYETAKGNTASQVWGWFGAEKGQAQCVILVHCTSPNELQDGSFHVAFVGFKEPCILKKELDRLGQSKWYSSDEAMRFLARQPYDTPIFRALTYGHDRLLSKRVRMQLQENYLTKEECLKLKPEEILTSIPNPEDFTLSEENVHGMLFVQHRVLPKSCTACEVRAWHQLDTGKSKGVILLREADSTPHSAFVAYEDAKARAVALAKRQFTSKASWTCVVRRVSVLADRGFQVLMSTTLGKDRAPTEAERAYMLHIRNTNTTPVSSDPMSNDTEPTYGGSTAAAIAIAASSQHTQIPRKEIDVAAAAAADKSDELFYLRIRKLPEEVTACKVWSWFQGSSCNSKSAIVVYGANNLAVCAYVGFENEMHRDMGVTNERFCKACTYHSRSVFLVDLKPSFKVAESTVTGVDKYLTTDDFAVIRYKLQQNAVEKKKNKDCNTNLDPPGQPQPSQNTQSTSVQASNSNGQSNLIETHPAQEFVIRGDHQRKMEIDKPVHQPKMEVDKPVHQTQMETDKPVHQPQMEIDKPVHQPQMEIDKPAHQAQMEIDKPVHQPQMEIDKPVHQPQMEIDKPVHQPQMEIDKPVHQPQMEIDKPVHQPQMEINNPAHQPQMEINNPAHQPQMEINNPAHQPQMEIEKPVQQPQMDIQQLLESVKNLHEAENTIYFRLVKLRPNITAGEVWSWFRGSRGPTRCATLVRDFDGTALFAYVGFVSDHMSYLENLELGTFSLCSPKARNIELASLHASTHVIQSSKQGDKPVLPETLSLFRAGIMGGAKEGTST